MLTKSIGTKDQVDLDLLPLQVPHPTSNKLECLFFIKNNINKLSHIFLKVSENIISETVDKVLQTQFDPKLTSDRSRFSPCVNSYSNYCSKSTSFASACQNKSGSPSAASTLGYISTTRNPRM